MRNFQVEFQNQGGEFVTSFYAIKQKLTGVKAYVFDWDGVFNDGVKHQNYGSPFSEIDAMGTNMLRFSHYLRTGEVPITCIVTGEKNAAGLYLAEREHFNGFYFNIKNKAWALEHLCDGYGLKPTEICFAFDDILDLSIAEKAGLRMMVAHNGNPMFKALVKDKGYADYITKCTGGQGAVREFCELLIGMNYSFEQVVTLRSQFAPIYQSYLEARQVIELKDYTIQNSKIDSP